MKIIETQFFRQQLHQLSAKYPKIFEDYEDFQTSFNPHFSTNLGDSVFKERCKNSSIPTGKRGGFRIIIKVFGDIAVPLLIYSKTIQENITAEELNHALSSVIKELSFK